jgi:protein-tyrosine-phosphatase
MRVLFVCTGNTCRGVLAEYIANRRFPGQVEATSAGIHPGSVEVTANAVYTLKQDDIDASGHRPRDVRKMNLAEFDPIVTMDNNVARTLTKLFSALPSDRIRKWQVKDPYGDDLAEYEQCFKVICRELKKMPSPKVEEYLK